MPNWAEGNIRVRGKRENIIRYIQENAISIYALQNGKYEERPIHLEEDSGGYELLMEKNPETDDCLWFKDSNRQFIDFDGSDSFSGEFSDDDKHTNKDQVLFLPSFKGAWGVDNECFRKAALEFKVDIRIFVWERGLEWSSISTFFRDGHVETESRTYADWLWESALPNYGG